MLMAFSEWLFFGFLFREMEQIPLYEEISFFKNLILAHKKAKKGKTKKRDVINFKRDYLCKILYLARELETKNYSPKPLETFLISDPKTRKISKSDFRDRIVHHALILVIGDYFERSFIYDSCANQIGKGTLFAVKRFDLFKRKVTKNFSRKAYCLKADIKHYFQEVDHEVLLSIIRRKIKDEQVIWLIKNILNNTTNNSREGQTSFCKKGMPLGNLTSQFFANVYLHELDYFAKHILRIKYYIRYVDDFVILHENKEQLEIWKSQIGGFLRSKLKIELHPQKSRIILLSKGIDFVGFRHFLHHRLLRKRNIQNMRRKIELFKQGLISKEKILESFQGWSAYAKWANCFKLRKNLFSFLLNSP